jgi:hypothetical protein
MNAQDDRFFKALGSRIAAARKDGNYVGRAFARLRQARASTHLAKRLAQLEDRTQRSCRMTPHLSRNRRAQLKQVFDAVRELITPPDTPKRPMGFVTPKDKGKSKRLCKEQDLTPRTTAAVRHWNDSGV